MTNLKNSETERLLKKAFPKLDGDLAEVLKLIGQPCWFVLSTAPDEVSELSAGLITKIHPTEDDVTVTWATGEKFTYSTVLPNKTKEEGYAWRREVGYGVANLVRTGYFLFAANL